MKTIAWALAVLASAVLAIAAGDGLIASHWLFVFKPLTTLLVIAFAWPRGADAPARRRWIRVGLGLSLAGDVALLWPVRGFLPGLVAFLLAHLAYIVAFTRGLRFAAWPTAFAAYAVLAGAILALLWNGVPSVLRLPVLAYVACLSAMAAQAMCAWHAAHAGGDVQAVRLARHAAIGGAVFVASDALLATDRFGAPLPLSALLILGSYWAAQWLIAVSMRAENSNKPLSEQT
ncbi:lysoplasmalogenase [Rhizobacter sp. SG703]|uniref:lysoplasmalogenase n=1 Tax=Rhizobacter sp. SG703 TaxID=2587140 RepID=UPI001446EB55|nr:lysoplasmalogenase [Rhizobacter sp. SG703]NKI95695.1 putative membrane protein YhhN [Rhizobacter sp. SG703]